MVQSYFPSSLLAANHQRSVGALAAFLFVVFTAPSAFADAIPVGRYVDKSVNADHEQLWPLVKTVSPDNRNCPHIRCAVDKVISTVGYSIYPGVMTVSAMNTLNKPVPGNHMRFNNLRIIEVVHALMGPAYQIMVDPYDRYISFELRQTRNSGFNRAAANNDIYLGTER